MKKILLFIVMLSISAIQTVFAASSQDSSTDVKPPPNLQTPAKATEITLWDWYYGYTVYSPAAIYCSSSSNMPNGYPNSISIYLRNLNYALTCPEGYAGPMWEASFAQAFPGEITGEELQYVQNMPIQGGQIIVYKFYCKIVPQSPSGGTISFVPSSPSGASFNMPDINVKAICLLR